MYAYGPVPSRRLGKSIGVSPIPAKTCSYSCVYCQLGKTNHLQVERESFYPKEDIFADINKIIKNSNADYITFDKMIQGIIDFRKEFTGEIWAEVMLVKDLNDSEKALKDIKLQLDKINPDRIYITTPVRPPAEKWVIPPEPEKILQAQTILNNTFNIVDRENGDFGVSNFTNASEALYEISSRHPLREKQAIEIEKKFYQKGTLEKMLNTGELIKYNYQDIFYIFPKKFKI